MELRVVVIGAGGKMGREVVKAVALADGMELVGGVDPACAGQDLGEVAGLGRLNTPISKDLVEALHAHQATVIVDFTNPTSVLANVMTAVENGVCAVVGTTGLSEDDWQTVDGKAKERGVGVIHAPNFAIGAVLLMRFAQEAARFMPDVEIIEMHHDEKRDAPSGTAMYTADMIRTARTRPAPKDFEEIEVAEGARGASVDGIAIHSVRLPGFVAHQEVIFGLPGQTLTIRHDSVDREAFMPGVILALRNIHAVEGVHVGLETLLF